MSGPWYGDDAMMAIVLSHYCRMKGYMEYFIEKLRTIKM